MVRPGFQERRLILRVYADGDDWHGPLMFDRADDAHDIRNANLRSAGRGPGHEMVRRDKN